MPPPVRVYMSMSPHPLPAPPPCLPADSAPAPPRVKRIPISDPALLAAVEGVRHGCVVCELRPADALALGLAPSGCEAASALTAYAPMALSAWKGKASLAIMVDKSETTQMVDKIVSGVGAKRGGGAA